MHCDSWLQECKFGGGSFLFSFSAPFLLFSFSSLRWVWFGPSPPALFPAVPFPAWNLPLVPTRPLFLFSTGFSLPSSSSRTNGSTALLPLWPACLGRSGAVGGPSYVWGPTCALFLRLACEGCDDEMTAGEGVPTARQGGAGAAAGSDSR